MNNLTNSSSLSFRPDLQGLRAIAIMLVVLAHTGLTIFPGGFIGVDVFFVLSGYLITALLMRELDKNNRISFTRFYAQRLKRLLPALISMLILVFCIANWLMSDVEARLQLASAPFSATWVSNLYFLFTNFDYFDELSKRDLFLHTWSLGVEEQFYLIWPAMLLLFFKSRKFLRIGLKNRLMLPALGMTFFVSLAISFYWAINTPQLAFYLMPSRIWQFSLGAIVYLTFGACSSDKNQLFLKLGKVGVYFFLSIGLLLIIGSAALLHTNLAYLGLWVFIPSLGTALVIAIGHALPKRRNNPLAHPVLVWIGDRSYSLYLWHWPVLVIGFSFGLNDQVLPLLGLILLSMIAAMLSFRFIELPFWKGSLSHFKPRHIILVCILAMLTTALGMYHGVRQLPQATATPDISNQWRSDVPIIYRMPCDDWYSNAEVRPCVFGGKTAEKTVVFIGDSIGAQWFSMIPAIFPYPDWRTIVLTKSSCAMVDEDYYYQRIGKTYQVCTDWRNAVLDQLDILKPDVLIMGSASTYDFSKTQWLESTSAILARVSKASTKVFILPGTPSLGFDGPGCISRNISENGQIDLSACVAKDRLKSVESVAKLLNIAANRFSNVNMLNLNDLVCPRGDCRAITMEGVIVFRDSQHLTDSFVRSQIPFVRERLERFNND